MLCGLQHSGPHLKSIPTRTPHTTKHLLPTSWVAQQWLRDGLQLSVSVNSWPTPVHSSRNYAVPPRPGTEDPTAVIGQNCGHGLADMMVTSALVSIIPLTLMWDRVAWGIVSYTPCLVSDQKLPESSTLEALLLIWSLGVLGALNLFWERKTQKEFKLLHCLWKHPFQISLLFSLWADHVGLGWGMGRCLCRHSLPLSTCIPVFLVVERLPSNVDLQFLIKWPSFPHWWQFVAIGPVPCFWRDPNELDLWG